jgi:membrane protease YdiL (CAAX protease family)
MMNFGVYNQVLVEWVLFALFVLVPIVATRNKVNWKWVTLAIGLFIVHKIILFLGVAGIYPDLISGRYNWEGKLAAILFLLLLAWRIFPNEHEEWGLRISQKGDAPVAGLWAAAFVFLAGTGMALFYFGGVREGETSDWLYQLSMPAIEEEIYYRGIMLLILDRAFDSKWKWAKVNWTWGAVIMIAMFYFTHIVHVDPNWDFSIVWGDFLPGVYGLLLMYLRLATGSLLLPILLHGWINVAGFII